MVVAYADYPTANAPSPDAVIVLGLQAKAKGILLDTYDKGGAGLTRLMDGRSLRAFVARARSAGLMVTLAGRLTADDIELAHEAGADIVGFRGAACEGGRDGVVTTARVRALRAQVDNAVAVAR